VNGVGRQGGSIFWKIAVVVTGAALLGSILIPLRTQQHAEELLRTTRLHLIDLYLAEQFFFEGRQYYTSDAESLISYLNNVRSLRIDTVEVRWYAASDTVRETDMWKVVMPRQRIRDPYVSPVDSSAYLLIVKNDGVSITVKDPNGNGRIEDGRASWLEGRKVR
jgi:hypothetical protein